MHDIPDNLNIHKKKRYYKPIDFIVLACFIIILIGLILISDPLVFSNVFGSFSAKRSALRQEDPVVTESVPLAFTPPVILPKFGDTPTLEELDSCITDYSATYTIDFKNDEGEITGKIKEVDTLNKRIVFTNNTSVTLPVNTKTFITQFDKSMNNEWKSYIMPYSVDEILGVLKTNDFVSVDSRPDDVEYIKVDCYAEK